MNIYTNHKYPIIHYILDINFKRIPLRPYNCFEGIDSDDSGKTDPMGIGDDDSELIDIFFNTPTIPLDDSVLDFHHPINSLNIPNAKLNPGVAFHQNGQSFKTIQNDGIARKFNQTVSQSLLCGYMALAGGLYQMDDIDFSDIYKMIGLDETKADHCNVYIQQKSYYGVQMFQQYFGYELFEFSKSGTFYNYLINHLQKFQYSDQQTINELIESTNVDRQRLELLLSFILNGKVPLYINDEHSDVLVPHIRLINRDGKHWECVNFKHLT